MTVSRAESRQPLRAADPGGEGVEERRWPGDVSPALLRDVVISDPDDRDGQTEILSLSRRRTGRPGWMVPVLAAVVVLAVVAAVALSHLDGAGRDQSAAKPSASPSASSTVAPKLSNQEKTVRLVDQLIAGVQPPPGARSVDHAPVASLRASGYAQSPVVVRSAWWTAPGTLKGTLKYYKQVAHWPDHAVPDGTSVTKSGGVVQVAGLAFTAGEYPTRAYAQLGLWVYVAPYRGGVAVHAQVSATVLPARAAAEHIGTDATSVDVIVARSGRPEAVRRTLTGSALTRLAKLVNAQVPAVPAVTRLFDCVVKAASKNLDRLSFHAPAGTVVVRVSDDRCPARAVEVVAAGTEQPALDGASTIDQAVIDALGLSPRYLLGS